MKIKIVMLLIFVILSINNVFALNPENIDDIVDEKITQPIGEIVDEQKEKVKKDCFICVNDNCLITKELFESIKWLVALLIMTLVALYYKCKN